VSDEGRGRKPTHILTRWGKGKIIEERLKRIGLLNTEKEAALHQFRGKAKGSKKKGI